jgi:hypothetical protein
LLQLVHQAFDLGVIGAAGLAGTDSNPLMHSTGQLP